MTVEKIITILEAEQQDLWNALKNAEIVFGIEHEAFKVARARWATTYELLKKIQNENN